MCNQQIRRTHTLDKSKQKISNQSIPDKIEDIFQSQLEFDMYLIHDSVAFVSFQMSLLI